MRRSFLVLTLELAMLGAPPALAQLPGGDTLRSERLRVEAAAPGGGHLRFRAIFLRDGAGPDSGTVATRLDSAWVQTPAELPVPAGTTRILVRSEGPRAPLQLAVVGPSDAALAVAAGWRVELRRAGGRWAVVGAVVPAPAHSDAPP